MTYIEWDWKLFDIPELMEIIEKINSIVIALLDNESRLIIKTEKEILTEEMRERILEAIEDSKKYGYALSTEEHRFFC